MPQQFLETMASKITPPRGLHNNLGATTSDKTARIMRVVILENYKTPVVQSICKNFVAELMRENWSFEDAVAYVVYKLAYYEPDTGAQTIRTPARVIDDVAANCVDYTVLICCIALNFYEPNAVCFCLAAYAPGDFSHVYPVINGQIIDVVPGQDQTGNERFTRPTNFFLSLRSRNGQDLTPVNTKFYTL